FTYTTGPENLVLLKQGPRLVHADALRQENTLLVHLQGQVFQLQIQPPPDVDTATRASTGEYQQKALTAPMAGTIVKVQVQDGDEVEQRQLLLILTAMKMEHTIIAPHAGKIKHMHYQ